MTTLDEDLLDEQVQSTLRNAYQATVPVHLRAGVDGRIQERMRLPPRPSRRWALRLRAPIRLSAVALAAAVIAAGALSQIHGSGPTPVSAQTVLSRAAAAGPAAGQAEHLTYRLTTSDGYTGTAELWVGSGAGLTVRQSARSRPLAPRVRAAVSGKGGSLLALRETMSRNGVPAPALNLQFVSAGGVSRTYDPAANTVTVGMPDVMANGGLRLLLGVFIGAKIGAQVQLGNEGLLASNHRLTHGTLGGVGVYTITLGDAGTLSFNDQTYVLQGSSWSDGSRSWQAHLATETTVPLGSVSAGTFDLHAPATATIVQGQQKDLGGASPINLMAALAAVCQTTQPQLKQALSASPDATPLQLCQETRPGITVDRLRTALLVQIQKQLDAAVSAGTISRDQANTIYANLEQKLAKIASTPVSGGGIK